MRVRHILTKADSCIRDFSNHQCDCMIVGMDHVKGLDPRPTHMIAGGWKYRLDLVSLENVGMLKISATNEKIAPVGPRIRYIPLTSLKEINPWLPEDDEYEAGIGMIQTNNVKPIKK